MVPLINDIVYLHEVIKTPLIGHREMSNIDCYQCNTGREIRLILARVCAYLQEPYGLGHIASD
ncbi:hypothetical protein J6590_071264 [Homalodisca vitripennis]|nr:hypothetical protein J6590_071264 [Homalodisca vitripennis]